MVQCFPFSAVLGGEFCAMTGTSDEDLDDIEQ